jgi:glycosyltransferase involved in cell wall biosynthesis
MTISVTVVIPTRNRPASLHRALTSLAAQQRPANDIIVVDSSDTPQDAQALTAAYPRLRLTYVRAAPSVCAQRNEGIERAQSTHILLCDDDIELPVDYLQRLMAFVEHHPETGAVTGVWCEPDAAGRFSDPFPVPSFRSLLTNFVAQRTVWGDVEAVPGNALIHIPLALLKRWYRRRGNSWSLSGWPLLTQIRAPAVQAAVYTLGSALIRRDWLLASRYDERAGPHGAGGDNYGVALGFPQDRPITLLTDLRVLHHKEQQNRIDGASGYYHRTLFLQYITRHDSRFDLLNRSFLAWTLLFNAAEFRLRGRAELSRASVRTLRAVLTGRNPLFAAPPGAVAHGDSGHGRRGSL